MIDSILVEYIKQMKQEYKNYKKAIKMKSTYINYALILVVYIVLSIVINKLPIPNHSKSIISFILFLLVPLGVIVNLVIMHKNMKKTYYNTNEEKLKILKSLLKTNHLYTKRKMTVLLESLDKFYPYKKFKLINLPTIIITLAPFISNPMKILYKYIKNNLGLSIYQIVVIALFIFVAVYLIFMIIFCVYQFLVNRKPYINRFKTDLQYLIIKES